MREAGGDGPDSIRLCQEEGRTRRTRGSAGERSSRRRGKEAPWVNCAASRSPRRRRKSVSVSLSPPVSVCAWVGVCVVRETNWIDIILAAVCWEGLDAWRDTHCTVCVCVHVWFCVSRLHP